MFKKDTKVSDKGWYVLYVRSKQEKKVQAILEKKEVYSYLPLEKSTKKWSDRVKIVEKPLFPSYIFIKVQKEGDFNKSLAVSGVCGFLNFGGKYAQVKDFEIQQLKNLLNTNGVSELETGNFLTNGETRKIRFGPFAGLDCEVLNGTNSNKVIVQIQSLCQTIRAVVPSKYLCLE